jgi:hypothetical protein
MSEKPADWSDAFVWEEDEREPVEKRYRVTGEAPVFDHAQGEEFTATLSIEQEEALTQYGHLEVVADEPTDNDEDTAHDDGSPVEADESGEEAEASVEEEPTEQDQEDKE